VSLRARLVVAFTYVLVLVIVALCVPLALNLSKRVDAEIKSEARGQAQLVATGASGQMNEPPALKRLVEESEKTLRLRGARHARRPLRHAPGGPHRSERPAHPG
jgi:sensor histidine kinase regulating citrate/malate metabolism